MKVLAAAVLLLVEGLLGLVCCSTKSLEARGNGADGTNSALKELRYRSGDCDVCSLHERVPLWYAYSELYCATWCRCSAMPLLLWTAVVMCHNKAAAAAMQLLIGDALAATFARVCTSSPLGSCLILSRTKFCSLSRCPLSLQLRIRTCAAVRCSTRSGQQAAVSAPFSCPVVDVFVC